MVNARIDVFLAALGAGRPQRDLVGEALGRARAYIEAGADCVYPIALRERDALAELIAGTPGPVNVLALARGPSLGELTELGAARVSYGTLLHRDAMARFEAVLLELRSRGR